MTKREVIKLVLEAKRPPYVPWNIGLTKEAQEKLQQHFGQQTDLENVLQNHPEIYDVGVIGIPDERLGEIVTAIIDPQPGTTLTEEEVIEFCEQNLPRYKRPRRIFFDKVPRNPTGKIEKPKLREKYAGQKESFKV